MEKSKYLSSGKSLGGHYEIVEVLGEDDFEILYLVKDRHLNDRLFVLKELFLEGISLRDEDNNLYSSAKSKYVFDETKKEVILETNRLQEAKRKQEIETYGYFEENNTVYIIMEFQNDAKLENYLHIKFKKEEGEMSSPLLNELNEKEIEDEIEQPAKIKKENKKSPIFLIGLIFLLSIFVGLAYYAFTIIEEDKEKSKKRPSTTTVEVVPHTPKPMSHPTLTTRDNSTKEKSTDIATNVERNETNITDEQMVVTQGTVAYIPPNTKVKIEENETTLEGVPKAELYREEEKQFPIDEKFDEKSVGMFLARFADALSNGSIETILSFYDSRVQKYFKSSRVTHQEIRKDREKYNAKWEYRDFRVGSFKLLKTYSEHGVEYCDVAVRTKWSVSTKDFKSDLGANMGSITLKKTPNGFKIKSIY